jgi:phage terminase Nu1 subunit (DNA packaging protein)
MSEAEHQTLEQWFGKAKKLSFGWVFGILMLVGTDIWQTRTASIVFETQTRAAIAQSQAEVAAGKAKDDALEKHIAVVEQIAVHAAETAEHAARQTEILEQKMLK